MYDDGELTAEEIAGVVGVARSTLYENLSACKDGGDCVMVAYSNTRPGRVDPDTNRRYGETRQSEAVQLEADRKWWNVAPAREARLRAWSTWSTAPAPGSAPSTSAAASGRATTAATPTSRSPRPSPTSKSPSSSPHSASASATRPHVRGKIREYLPL